MISYTAASELLCRLRSPRCVNTWTSRPRNVPYFTVPISALYVAVYTTFNSHMSSQISAVVFSLFALFIKY